jgi:hypothetical protein
MILHLVRCRVIRVPGLCSFELSIVKLQKAFAEYTARTAFERPLMTGVAYAHKVLHSEREEFERKQGWSIKTMHSKETSPVREEYAPTIFSQETIGYLVSLDMMSGEVCAFLFISFSNVVLAHQQVLRCFWIVHHH